MTYEDHQIKEAILEQRPNLSSSSINTYMGIIRKMSKTINTPLQTIDDIIANADKIYDSLADDKVHVRKTKLSAFIVALDQSRFEKSTANPKDNSDNVAAILIKFRNKMYEDLDIIKTKDLNQELTPQQDLNFITWDEVVAVHTAMKKEVNYLWSLKIHTTMQFRSLMMYVLLSLYVLTPPRRSIDYSDFYIRKINPTTHNYLLNKLKTKPAHLVFNSYKNSTRLGPQKVEISKELRTILEKFIAISPYDTLIVNSNGNKVQSSFINKSLNQIFQKNIGSTMLRHIYTTHHFGNVDLKALQQATHDMGNKNIERTCNYVSKEHAPSSPSKNLSTISTANASVNSRLLNPPASSTN